MRPDLNLGIATDRAVFYLLWPRDVESLLNSACENHVLGVDGTGQVQRLWENSEKFWEQYCTRRERAYRAIPSSGVAAGRKPPIEVFAELFGSFVTLEAFQKM